MYKAKKSPPPPFVYESRLNRWHEQASVRAYPRRCLSEHEESGKCYFAPDLVPISQHVKVVALGPEAAQEIQIQHLYTYLEFTTVFELKMVNTITNHIILKNLGVLLPDEMLADAYKIYCDEGYHGFFSYDLILQVQAATNVAPNPVDNAPLVSAIEKIIAAIPLEHRQLARVFAVIVYETLVSAILSKVPRSQHVATCVRRVIADHAEDEGRHHVYFSALMDALWPQLTKQQKDVICPLLPRFILKSLEPNLKAYRFTLAKLDLGEDDIESILQDCYPQESVIAYTRETASATLNLFRRNEVFADVRAYELFQAARLLD
jgi:hypothetical protein